MVVVRIRYLSMLPVLLIGAGCGESASRPANGAQPKAVSVAFQGMIVPGRMSEAELSGFAQCSSDYYRVNCKRSDILLLYGVRPKSMEVNLDGRDNFSQDHAAPRYEGKDVRAIPVNELSYRSVEITFPAAAYDRECLERHRSTTGKAASQDRPLSCIENTDTIEHFAAALLRQGWINHRSPRGYYAFVHPDEAVQIILKNEIASVRAVAKDELREALAEAGSHPPGTPD